jgi:hypothetical protein
MKIKNINSFINNNLTDNIENFLNSLQVENEKFQYYPCINYPTLEGAKLRLGFSCYAVKIKHTINRWESIPEEQKDDWATYINSFQKTIKHFPTNSYIDDQYLKNYRKTSMNDFIKDNSKKAINVFQKKNIYETKSERLFSYIRAESKQSMATLNEISSTNFLPYQDFPKEKTDINLFLNSFNWQKPWSAGAQFAGLCFFTSTQIKNNLNQKSYLQEFIKSKLNSNDGFYYDGITPNISELVNGTMKVLTGLDWLDIPIHCPEKIIDNCLKNSPSQVGCDLVDYVYVLYRCSLETKYKRKEVIDYLVSFYELIFQHYYEDSGGFSYGVHESQKLYYGVRISKGGNEADIHGTLLLTWALSMIFNITENNDYGWKVIRP